MERWCDWYRYGFHAGLGVVSLTVDLHPKGWTWSAHAWRPCCLVHVNAGPVSVGIVRTL